MRALFLPSGKLPGVMLATAAAACALVLRSPDSDLSFLVAPAAKAVSLFTGVEHVSVDGGMAFPPLGIVIDRSCSGASFMVVVLAVSALLLWRIGSGGRSAWLRAIVLLVLAYPVAVLVNSARIVGILQAQHMLGPLSPASHEALGAFMMLAFLLMFSLLATRLTRPAHARPA